MNNELNLIKYSCKHEMTSRYVLPLIFSLVMVYISINGLIYNYPSNFKFYLLIVIFTILAVLYELKDFSYIIILYSNRVVAKSFVMKPVIINYDEINDIKSKWTPYGFYYVIKTSGKKITISYTREENEKVVQLISKFKGVSMLKIRDVPPLFRY